MNNKKKKIRENGVTVLICTYNGEKNLPATLLHLSRQKVDQFLGWEVILVDNASNDNSTKVALETWNSLNVKFPLTVLRENIPGKDNAIDLGFAKAKYSYVIICDDDNWLHEDYVQLAYSIIIDNPKIGVLGGKGVPAFEEGCIIPDWFNYFQKFYAVGPQAYLNGEINHYWPTYRFIWGAGAVVNLEAYSLLQASNFKRILSSDKYPKVARSEDVELSLAIWLTGYKLWFDDRLVFQHYISKEKLRLSNFIKVVKQSISAIHYLRPYQILIFMGAHNAPAKSFWKQYIIYYLRFLFRQLRSPQYLKNWTFVIFNKHSNDMLYIEKAIEWYQVISVIKLGKGYDDIFKRTAQLQYKLSLIRKTESNEN